MAIFAQAEELQPVLADLKTTLSLETAGKFDEIVAFEHLHPAARLAE